ncbi:helix-turn-helix domain-containing protein [Nakamurella sp.]|uniref:helix-turn-helix domain-containing protein n=1 Tax=Nakamurella sp. TaxID=1869182 RepID=UPI003B3AF37C
MLVEEPGLTEVRRWLVAADRLTRAVNSPAGLRDVLDLVAETARDLLGYDFCAVLLPDPTGGHLVITGWSGLSDEYVASVNADRPVRLALDGQGQAPSGRAFSSGRVVAIADITAEPQFGPWGGVARDQGYRAMVSVPLVADGTVLGTLNGYHARVHTFAGDEVERLTMLAGHAAIALSTARLVDRLRDQADLLARSERIHRQLLDVALGGGGLGGIADSLAELIGRPVLIEDGAGRVAAASGSEVELPGPELRRSVPVGDGAGRPGDGPVRSGWSDGDEWPGGDHGGEGAGEVVPDGGAGRPGAAGFRVWSVPVAGEVAARIWVPGGELTPLDRRAVEHATLVVSLELARLRTGVEVELRVRGELLTDVLGGAAVDSIAIRDRARRLGHDLSGPAVVIVGRAEPVDPGRRPVVDQRTLAAVADLAAGYRPRPLVGAQRGLVVVLWPAGPTVPRVPTVPVAAGAGSPGGPEPAAVVAAAEQVRRAMRSVPGVAAATVAVAGPVAGHPQAFRTARGAWELAVAGGRHDTTVTLHGLGVAGLLLQLDDTAQLLEFADRTLHAVRAHDAARGTRLLATLRYYLTHGQSRTGTAAALHLHPNTVTQRLARIQALTGLDLTDPAAVVQMRAAVLVLDVARARSDTGTDE